MSFCDKRILILLVLLVLCLDLCSGSGGFGHSWARQDHAHHDHDHGHHHGCGHDHGKKEAVVERKLPEELAEEEDMRLCGFGPCPDHVHHHHQDHDHESDSNLSGLGLWLHALGCSLLVSLASLVCLVILPLIFIKGKPSKAVVDSLALFGAGAMLGDAFLHQLPHAFGGGHSHSRDHHVDNGHHGHSHSDSDSHSHSHSLKDLAVGLSVLAGIVLFLLVEKLVRYVEEHSTGSDAWGHGHHNHHHKNSKKPKEENDHNEKHQQSSSRSEEDKSKKAPDGLLNGDGRVQLESSLRKRKTSVGTIHKSDQDAAETSTNSLEHLDETESFQTQSKLVFGYLNLFSDGVHNFTDGMALGSAFLLYGSVGGWSRTLFLLAHELPQEIGDFGILVRSGFTVSKALFFNFLSALVALAGTTMALLLGKDPGQSSLIEGFTAGGFIYIAVAGVLAEMNNTGKTMLKNTATQVTALVLGMAVALWISLVE